MSVFLCAFLAPSAAAQSANTSNYFTAQAEDMTVDPSNAGMVASDSTAWWSKFLILRRNANAATTITTAEPVDAVVLRARGQLCRGAPQATVYIDGTKVMSSTIASATWDYYAASTFLPAGSHTVEVRFTNDHYLRRSCDRNLLVDQVALRAADPPLFADDFEREVDEFEPPWDVANSASADRLTTSSDVARKGTYSAKFTVEDDDVAPLTYSENPRAQLNKNGIFCEGDERWVGFSVYFPTDFPTLPSYGWLVVNSFGFRPPYGTGGVGSLVVAPGDTLRYEKDSAESFEEFWSMPMERGRWIDFVFRVKFSDDPSVGYTEIWKDGQKQTLANGEQRVYHQTLGPAGYSTCGNLQPANYRKKGMFGSATLYQDEIKVGTSYAAAAP